jgi:hypothetical protein
MYIDHQPQHKRVYYLDRNYDDVLEGTVENRMKMRRILNLPKIANGKSNGMIILVESIVLTMKERS